MSAKKTTNNGGYFTPVEIANENGNKINWTATQIGVCASMGIFSSYRRNNKTFVKEKDVLELYQKIHGTNGA
jgi:hypothetical protein